MANMIVIFDFFKSLAYKPTEGSDKWRVPYEGREAIS
jgi:hypothetical protein